MIARPRGPRCNSWRLDGLAASEQVRCILSGKSEAGLSLAELRSRQGRRSGYKASRLHAQTYMRTDYLRHSAGKIRIFTRSPPIRGWAGAQTARENLSCDAEIPSGARRVLVRKTTAQAAQKCLRRHEPNPIT